MTERGASPPHGGFNKVGEGAGHKVKRGKGNGYARPSHHEGLAGPRHGGHGGEGGNPHTGYHTTGEHKGHGSAMHLPMEHNVKFRKGIDKGDHFEAEIREHFPGKKGVAGINKTAMHHKNSPTPSEGVSHEHGHVSGKAEHLPCCKEPHTFKQPMLSHSHGFGHDHEQRSGALRLSGHKSAHRLGSRSKK
jgi:hypothetical protein